ncbi:MAG TPA: hypothetical protein VE011_08510 [Candidatus Dormibacteraeota bacterium]|nr:hypothetical protein [Candidatus Dormibacteraeota bacterium]
MAHLIGSDPGAAPGEPIFRDAIDRLYAGELDAATDRLLAGST